MKKHGMAQVPPEKHDEFMGRYARTLLQVEMRKRQMTYRDLTERLTKKGAQDNERNVRNKVARGTFSAAFFLDCLLAIGCRVLELGYSHPNHPEMFGLYFEPSEDDVTGDEAK